MAQKDELYECTLCGLLVRVVRAGTCTPCCCGQPMRRVNDEGECLLR